MTPAETRDILIETMGAEMQSWFEANRLNFSDEMAEHLLDTFSAKLRELGLKIVPVEATEGLLISMALRMDHAFGMPDMGEFEYRKPNIRAWQDARLTELRKAHEEVVGTGFYSPEKEADYTAMLAAAPDVLGGAGE